MSNINIITKNLSISWQRLSIAEVIWISFHGNNHKLPHLNKFGFKNLTREVTINGEFSL